jgi:pimeloyl-ACP methyl ester carboxylesterase
MNTTTTMTPVEASGGVLGHRTHGHGEGRVIALHDWMGDAANYESMTNWLDPARLTWAFADLRGYGASRSLTGEYTVEESAADVFRLADALGWRRFHVVGHSMSGMVVQRMAIDDRTSGARRLASVVAITPVSAAGYPADAATKEFLLSLIGRKHLSSQGFALLTGGRLSARWSEAKTERHLATTTPEVLEGYYRMWLETDFSEAARAAAIPTPMLVVGGRQDLPGFQEEQLRATFGAWYSGAELTFITDAGHYPMQETPAYLAALIEGFITRHA